jgi:hypothetical protein
MSALCHKPTKCIAAKLRSYSLTSSTSARRFASRNRDFLPNMGSLRVRTEVEIAYMPKQGGGWFWRGCGPALGFIRVGTRASGCHASHTTPIFA